MLGCIDGHAPLNKGLLYYWLCCTEWFRRSAVNCSRTNMHCIGRGKPVLPAENMILSGVEMTTEEVSATTQPKRPTIDPDRLERHRIWLESEHQDGERLVLDDDLRGNDIQSGADLHGLDLREARISANLRYADLRGTNLKGADLHGVILWDTDLTDADLSGCTGLVPSKSTSGFFPLSGADLSEAILPDSVSGFPALANVTELCKNAGGLYITLITGDAVILLMSLKTTDQQLVLNSSTATIPFLNAEVPISMLFLIGPMLVLVNYLALLFYMQKLWEVIASLPAVFPDGLTLDQKSYPWMATNIVRRYFARLANRPQALATTQRHLFTHLIYTVIPISVVPLWGRYLAAHEWKGTVAQIAIISCLVFYWWTFQRVAKATLSRNIEYLNRLLSDITRDTYRSKLKLLCRAPTIIAFVCAALMLGITRFGALSGRRINTVPTPVGELEERRPHDSFAYMFPRILEPLHLSLFVDVHERDGFDIMIWPTSI